MTTVAIIDYGAGNLTSVMRGLRRAGLDPAVATSPSALADAAGIIVPGVGHFSATRAITDEWRAALTARVNAGVPLLGICLGMQWLFEGSTEAPGLPGLALARGSCQALDDPKLDIGSRFGPSSWGKDPETTPDVVTDLKVKVPHLGWNTLRPVARPSRLLAGIAPGAFAYFAHSFAAPVGPETVATTLHGAVFASAIERDNVFGVQFHPELSAETGAAVFANFAKVVTR